MKWIKFNRFRINTENITSYGLNDQGNSYVDFIGSASIVQQGTALAETLDAELHLRESAARPADVRKLSDWGKRKVAEFNDRKRRSADMLSDIA